MPDWFAHLMFAMCLSTCLRLTKEKRVLFFIGNVMPDFVRLLTLLSNMVNFKSFTTLVANPLNSGSHTLLGVLAYALFISIFFEPSLGLGQAPLNLTGKSRGYVFLQKWQALTEKPVVVLVIGGIAHLFLDTFMWPFGGGLNWLYPLSGAAFSWSFKAWWPSSFDAIIILTPFFVAAVIAEVIIARIKKRTSSRILLGTTSN